MVLPWKCKTFSFFTCETKESLNKPVSQNLLPLLTNFGKPLVTSTPGVPLFSDLFYCSISYIFFLVSELTVRQISYIVKCDRSRLKRCQPLNLQCKQFRLSSTDRFRNLLLLYKSPLQNYTVGPSTEI